MPYQFLSDEWVSEAKRIREEYRDHDVPPIAKLRMNQIVTGVPFGEGVVHTYMDTTAGGLDMDLGHLPEADVTMTVDYETAKAIIVDGNPQAGMQAFMAGKMKVQGDMAKLMQIQQQLPMATAQEVAAKIREITA